MNFMKKFFNTQFFRFIIVGVVNTIFGTALMFGLYNMANCSYWSSSVVSCALASTLSFFLNKHFTFQNKNTSFKQMMKFVVNIIICYLMSYGVVKAIMLRLLVEQSANIQNNASMFVGMCLFTILNFFGQKFFAFGVIKNKKC